LVKAGDSALNGEHQTHDHDHEHAGAGGALDEEEMRARLEEELSRITVRDVLVQTVVTLINLGGQRLGLTESTKAATDPEQTRIAIEAVRGLLPLLEAEEGGAQQVKPVRDALAQLQMAYAQVAAGGSSPAEKPAADEAETAGRQAEGNQGRQPPGGGARSSGRLWVPPGTKT
jgi:hypothetical protein